MTKEELGTVVKVLDHGYIKVVDYMGNDASIVEAARMSTGKGFISWDPYERCDSCGLVRALDPHGQLGLLDAEVPKDCSKHKMVQYPNGDVGMLDTLWRKKHATPFEMGDLILEVMAPIMVFREWHRHRTQSFNEFSARYSLMPNLHYLPDLSRIQKQSTHNKQGSAEVIDEEIAEEILTELKREQDDVYDNYETFVNIDGVAKEVARINTPVSRYSKMRAKGNLRNWFQFLNLRMRPDAQWEIRQYANIVGEFIKKQWPKAYELFEEYDLYGAHFSRSEMRLIREKCMVDLNLPEPVIEKALGSKTKAKEFLEKLRYGGDRIL